MLTDGKAAAVPKAGQAELNLHPGQPCMEVWMKITAGRRESLENTPDHLWEILTTHICIGKSLWGDFCPSALSTGVQ